MGRAVSPVLFFLQLYYTRIWGGSQIFMQGENTAKLHRTANLPQSNRKQFNANANEKGKEKGKANTAHIAVLGFRLKN
jgi:hypothetical protein